MVENIKNFFIRLDSQKRSTVTFADAVLGGRTFAYIWHRLRYFTLKSLLMIMIRCIEFYLIFYLFDTQIAISILTFRIISFMGSSFWWGALESFRESIREYSQDKQKIECMQLYKQWRNYAGIYAALMSGIILVLFAYHLSQSDSSSLILFSCYVAAIIAEVISRTYVLTKHSLCFATHRVYRPFLTIIGPPLASLVVLGVSWHFIAGYSLVLAGLTQASLALYWTWKYTTFTLNNRRLVTESITPKTTMTTHHFTPRSIIQACCSLLMDGSGVIVLVILHDFTNLYLLAPLIAVCFNWSKLFYFDNIKFGSRWLRALTNHLNHTTRYASLIIALSLTVMSAIIFGAIDSDHNAYFILALALFFAARALLSLKFIILFTRAQYLTLLIYNGLLTLSIIIFSQLNLPMNQLLLFIGISQLIIYFAVCKEAKDKPYFPSHTSLLPYFCWRECITPHCVIDKITLTPHCTQPQQQAIINAIHHSHQGQVLMSLSDRNTLLILQTNTTNQLDDLWLATHASGLIMNFQHHIDHLAFEPHHNHKQTDMIAQFNQIFPHGIVIDLTQPQRPKLPYENQLVLSSIIRYMNQPYCVTTTTPYYCSALYRNHQLAAIFILPKSTTDYELAARWQHQLLSS